METLLWITIGLFAIFLLFGALSGIAACMLSSQISQDLEKHEHR